ncbi:MAG TPA: serine/threonine-protein kinase [Verrucomicrobiota bacterium]|nr:serine/threonine-protein kinase [Verrucomicrobiota bacterium]
MFGLFKSSKTTDPREPGQFGRFHLQELINSGGMADIWLATDSNHKVFALRRLHERLKSDSTARKRFLRGCEVLEKLRDNDGIIGYYEHGKIDGQLYLLMEYLEGANLKHAMARRDAALTENVAQVLLDMAGALERVHENGYMHLDFKPENVLITHGGTVRLVDFDLAQEIPTEPVKLDKNPGTPAYMAPEQLSGQAIDQRVDIFAFGVAAYELVTEQKPFPGESAQDILARQMDRSEFVMPRQVHPELPANLERIIVKCIETQPGRRYPFMSVLLRELQTALYV